MSTVNEARAKFDTKKFIMSVEAQVRAFKEDAKFSEDQCDWDNKPTVLIVTGKQIGRASCRERV